MTIATMEELARSGLRVTAEQLDGVTPIDCIAIAATEDGRLRLVERFTLLGKPYLKNDDIYVDVLHKDVPEFDDKGCSGWTTVTMDYRAASWGIVPGWRYTKICVHADQSDRIELVEDELPEWERELLSDADAR